MVIVMTQQNAPDSQLPFQAHLVLETLPRFRLILHWITLTGVFLDRLLYNLGHNPLGRNRGEGGEEFD